MNSYCWIKNIQIFVDKRLDMIITRWKVSKILKAVSTIMTKYFGQVIISKGSITEKFLDGIITHQKHMDGVYR